MKKREHLKRPLAIVALATALILSVPLIAMQFTREVDWSLLDFIVMGALIFSTGLSYVLLTRTSTHVIYRIAMALVLGTTFLMIWANLAVGLIGSGAHAGNLMYLGVVFVVIMATIRSGFHPRGMERAMYSTALSLCLLATIALLAGMQHYPGTSVKEIIGINVFFAALFLVAGSLFRFAAQKNGMKQQLLKKDIMRF